MKQRISWRIVIAVTVVLLVGATACCAFISFWVPTKGKAWLEAEVERALAVDISIRSMRYAPFRGLLLEDVRAVARSTHETWFAAPTMNMAIGWPLLLQGDVVFRALAPMNVPCHATLRVGGRYALRTKTLTVDVQTSKFALNEISGPLAHAVPVSLREGDVQLTLHAMQSPAHTPTITGRITGSRLAWTTPMWRAHGDFAIDGAAIPPSQSAEPWTVRAAIAVHAGTLDGPAPVGTVSQLDGTARLDGDHLEIVSLTGTVLGSRWTVEGTVAPLGAPAIELLLHSRVELAPLVGPLTALTNDWSVAGPVDIQTVCRGPLSPHLFLDCLIHAQPRDVTLTHPKLSSPITHVSGRLAYDALEQHLSIDSLSARVLTESLTIRGNLLLHPPAQLTLTVNGRVPLDALNGWLPVGGPITELGGMAGLDLAVRGRLNQLHYKGQVNLQDIAAACPYFPNRIEHLTGAVRLADDQITATGLAFRTHDQPVTLTASITSLDEPRITATMRGPGSSLTLVSRLTPDHLAIDDGQITLAHSRVHLTGSIARAPKGPSALDLEGVVELADLEHLPFAPLPVLAGWHLQGPATVEAQFRGRFSSWTDAALRGRLQADRLMVRDIPVEHLTCDVEQADRVLRLRIPSALIGDGKFVGGLSLEPQGTAMHYALQADLVQLQLAALTHMIPAWKDRPVRGIASAHAMASGMWQTRSSWRGDGWLNASGEQLGEVPLLDTVFRGLFGVLGDRLGLDALRRAQITQVSVQWQLASERFSTEDLRLGGLAGTEPMAIYAKGSVGMDQTLDFVVEPELSEGTILEAPTTSTLASTVLKAAGRLERLRRLIGRHRLVGTLKNPDYRFELSSKEIFKQVAPANLLQSILDSLR